MADRPTREFGRRKPVAIPAAEPVKRSSHVALLLMGTFAIGGGAYALMPRDNCGQQPAMASGSQTGAECRPGGSSSGGHGWSSSRSSFFGGDSSANRSSPGGSADAGSGGVPRGGFGSFARAFSAHFSGGG